MHKLVPLALLLWLGSAQGATTTVTTAQLDSFWIFPERTAPAEVVSLNNADLSAEISAKVIALPAKVGDEVQGGDLLATLDCRDFISRHEAQQASLRQLQAQRKLAANQLNRTRNLQRDRNVSQEEVDRRETELSALDAQLAAQQESVQQAALNVERCEVRAPFRAAVTDRWVSVGALAAPGTPLLRLVQLDALEISAHIRPVEAEQSATAAAVAFVYLGQNFPLALRRIVPVVDPQTRTIEVRWSFQGKSAPPGASGRLYWLSATPHVPADLIVRRGEQLGLFLLQDEVARFHPLPKAVQGQPAATELPATTRIIQQGRHRLTDGDPVIVAE